MNKYGAEQRSQEANINGVCFSGFAFHAASVGANRRIQANKVASAPHGDSQQTQRNNGCLVSIPLVRFTQRRQGVWTEGGCGGGAPGAQPFLRAGLRRG